MPSKDPLTPSTRFLDDHAIRRILSDRIDTRREGVGIVVGMVGDGERRIVGYGRFDQNDAGSYDPLESGQSAESGFPGLEHRKADVDDLTQSAIKGHSPLPLDGLSDVGSGHCNGPWT